MSMGHAGLMSLATDDLELDQKREVIRRDAGRWRSDGFDALNCDSGADEDMVDAQHRQARREGGPGLGPSRQRLNILEMCGQTLVGA